MDDRNCTCPPGAHGSVAGCAGCAAPAFVSSADDDTARRWEIAEQRMYAVVLERDALRAQLAAVTRERDEACRGIVLRAEVIAAMRAERDDARALLADALRCGLDEAERLRAERGTLLDAHAEERDVWEASRACDLVAERDAAVSERDHERERHAFWRGLAGSRADGLQVVERERDALARRVATLRTALERAHAAASWGVANAAVVEALAADDAATAGGTTGG